MPVKARSSSVMLPDCYPKNATFEPGQGRFCIFARSSYATCPIVAGSVCLTTSDPLKNPAALSIQMPHSRVVESAAIWRRSGEVSKRSSTDVRGLMAPAEQRPFRAQGILAAARGRPKLMNPLYIILRMVAGVRTGLGARKKTVSP